MSKATNAALERVAKGLQQLLSALARERDLHIDYERLGLDNACSELRDALREEPVE